MSKVNLKDKHLRYGGYGALLTLLVIAITIVLNIIVTNLNLKIDATSEKLYSLCDTTKEVVATINEPVNIYVLEETGMETDWIQEVLMKYTDLNSNLNLIYKDPVLYPAFGSSYLERSNQNISSINNTTVIIENTLTGKFKIIPPSDFVSVSESSGPSLTLENSITNGLGYVMNENDGLIYYTTGHNEVSLPESLTNCFNRANLTMQSINLLTEEMPDPEQSALVIYSPHSDFTKDEVTKVIDFLSRGGKAMIFLDYDMPELTHFNELLNYYSIRHQIGVAVETNTGNIASTSPIDLLPAQGNHDILDTMGDLPIIVPGASGIEKLSNSRTTITLTPLLGTSNNAFLKRNTHGSTYEKEEGDIDGPIVISCAIEEKTSSTDTKLFVMASTNFLNDNKINVSATGNTTYINSSLGWLFSLDTQYAIEAKTEDVYTIRALSSFETLMIEILVMAIIPLIVVILGITVWIKRRHL
ncbi:MAG: GldG family protein [Cellulosilyticum sp.]|nr:GldG family protein [Cellulosilyticum sp.]